jgi:hypothetical protein
VIMQFIVIKNKKFYRDELIGKLLWVGHMRFGRFFLYVNITAPACS